MAQTWRHVLHGDHVAVTVLFRQAAWLWMPFEHRLAPVEREELGRHEGLISWVLLLRSAIELAMKVSWVPATMMQSFESN